MRESFRAATELANVVAVATLAGFGFAFGVTVFFGVYSMFFPTH